MLALFIMKGNPKSNNKGYRKKKKKQKEKVKDKNNNDKGHILMPIG